MYFKEQDPCGRVSRFSPTCFLYYTVLLCMYLFLPYLFYSIILYCCVCIYFVHLSEETRAEGETDRVMPKDHFVTLSQSAFLKRVSNNAVKSFAKTIM